MTYSLMWTCWAGLAKNRLFSVCFLEPGLCVDLFSKFHRRHLADFCPKVGHISPRSWCLAVCSQMLHMLSLTLLAPRVWRKTRTWRLPALAAKVRLAWVGGKGDCGEGNGSWCDKHIHTQLVLSDYVSEWGTCLSTVHRPRVHLQEICWAKITNPCWPVAWRQALTSFKPCLAAPLYESHSRWRIPAPGAMRPADAWMAGSADVSPCGISLVFSLRFP